MTILEKQSLRKKKSILYLVENGEYSIGYALLKVEELYDNGKLTDADYEELADYLEELLNKVEEVEEIVNTIVDEPEEKKVEENDELHPLNDEEVIDD